MPRVLLVHRSHDSDAVARRLCDALAAGMPDVAVLNEVAAATPVDRDGRSRQQLAGASALVVVIGQPWRAMCNDDADSDAAVDGLVEQALASRVWTIPVLVQGAGRPESAALLEDGSPLSAAEPIELRHVRWNDDVMRLIDRIERHLAFSNAPFGFGAADEHAGRIERARLFVAGIGLALDQLRRRIIRRSKPWQRIKQAAAVGLALALAAAGYAGYRYASTADLREIERLSVQLSYDSTVESTNSILSQLRDVTTRANDPMCIEAAAARLKAFVLSGPRTTVARRIRRHAMETLKTLRANDLTRDFANQELKAIDLFTTDLSSAHLARVSLEDARLEGVNLVGADLRESNLSGAYIRNGNLTGADITDADITELDWFNAAGFSAAQLQSASRGTVPACPPGPSKPHSVETFRSKLHDDYGYTLDQFSLNDRTQFATLWAEYAKPGGLCDIVDQLLK
jgi:hypothetical protein